MKPSILLCAVLCSTWPMLPAKALAYDPMSVSKAEEIAPLDLVVTDATRRRDIPVRIYLPAEKAAAPVVFFSHGLGGTKDGSAFLGKHWASRGYVAVYTQHAGSDDSVWKNVSPAERVAKLKGAASLASLTDRVRDIPAVLDQLTIWNQAKDHPLSQRLDLEKVGMSGHSFGAVTTQAMSGQTFPAVGAKFTDPRIKAAVAFSPSLPRVGEPAAAFGQVKIPWLLMTGTKDEAAITGITAESRLKVFPALPAGNKYELVLDGAEHSVFTERALSGESGRRDPKHHPAILALSTAFWDAYLRGDAEAKAWLDGEGPRTVLEKADHWQRK